MGVENLKETEIGLPDIRTTVNKIADVEQRNDILDHLKVLETQLADKAAIVAKIEAENARLLKKNSELFMRVDSFQEKEKPDTKTDYSDMDRTKLTNLIEQMRGTNG